jgi:hypothetical protein
MNKKSNESKLTGRGAYSGARPMVVHVDSSGTEWLCDKNVNSDSNYAQQGCWRTDMMAFNRND